MVKKKIPMLIIPLAALILEILPYGAVCVFAADKGERIRQTFSYFDLTPFGYANFGPFITAILTCALFVLAVVYALKQSKGLNTTIKNISGIATATSLMPLLYGVDFFSVFGAVITVLLAGTFGVCFIKEKQ